MRVCPKCPKTFVRKDALTRHLATHNKPVKRPQPRPQPPASASGTKRQRAEKVSDVFTKRTIRPTEEVAEDLLLFQEEARPQIAAALEEDLTAKTDVLLLADVFENFWKLTMDNYGLDAAHMFTAPRLAWHAALKMTGVELELFTDIDMHLFIERGTRGGVSMISQRYSKANVPGTSTYDAAAPNRHIMYLDANNLYGWAMSQALPVNNFEWMDDVEKITTSDIASWTDDGDKGYILGVDLDYPQSLHDAHNGYPLAPKQLHLSREMLSPTALNILNSMDLKPSSNNSISPKFVS
ncbi:hypothetical protein JTE90_012907 [Oedothorax gibbosus]|uniref:C2H2-type domain-containing protein n=1 Tax=Oedothorax gibbosus TaxID=931172 RepID=A0AAV6UHC6_9ARAC|nr:hypothetical protein JTE90_012907 [Oedothorax gibbosus]